jgi:predicted N-acyltransferase
MYLIKIYNSIISVKKEDWDLLTENNVFMCYEYLKTFEETIVYDLLPYYICVSNEDKIIAASVCYFEKSNTGRNINNIFLGRLYRYGFFKKISFLPAVICNRQRGDGTHFIFSNDINDEQIIYLQNKMLDEIENIAEKHKASVCFLNIIEDEADLIRFLKKRRYINTIDLPSNFIEVNWTSFEGYKKHLSKKYSYMEKSIRHQLNRNRKSGVVIVQLQNIDDHQGRLIELLKMNHFKYNTSIFPLKPNYFHQVKENFGNNAVIYAAKKNGSIIGVSIELRKGREAFFSSLGVDHDLSKKDMTYFNIAYYEPIKNATESKIKKIYYGIGLYRTKIKRGCNTKDMLVFYKPQNKFSSPVVKLWFTFHKQWMKNKLAYIKKL